MLLWGSFHSYANIAFFILLAGIIAIGSFGIRIVRFTADLEKLSNIDGLTQVANRSLFEDTLHQEGALAVADLMLKMVEAYKFLIVPTSQLFNR